MKKFIYSILATFVLSLYLSFPYVYSAGIGGGPGITGGGDDARYVNVDGDTMTGNLSLPGNGELKTTSSTNFIVLNGDDNKLQGASLYLYAASHATLADRIQFVQNGIGVINIGSSGGLYSTNAAGTDKGADTANFEEYYAEGVRVGQQGPNDANYPVFSTSELDDSSLTESTWETVGPTGAAGNTVTWPGLDSIPTDAEWVRLKVKGVGHEAAGTANTTRYAIVHAREASSASGIADLSLLSACEVYTSSTGNGKCLATGEFTVQLNSLNQFDLYWAITFASSEDISVHVVGYGYNGH